MLTENRTRFKDAPWIPTRNESIIIGGAGGIGSWLSFFLARIGFNIYLHDDDLIEEHNLGGQLFKTTDIYKSKVQAVQDIVREYSATDISISTTRITETSPYHIYMMSAFDNMLARSTMFNLWKNAVATWSVANEEDKKNVPIFIDGRLEAEQLQIFCVTPSTILRYERDHLFADSNVEELSCTMKQTSHTAAMIATHMTAFFTNHITNVYEEEVFREVPFSFEYIIPSSQTIEKR